MIQRKNKNTKKPSKKLQEEELFDMDTYDSSQETKAHYKRELAQMSLLPNSGLKTESQKKLMKTILDNKITFIKGPAGTGKAQPLDSNILTPSGWVKMGDLKVGDNVITKDGSSTRITGVFSQGKKEVYRVTFSDGSFTECCDEHLWFTTTHKDRKAFQKKEGSVKTLKEIRKSLFSKKGTSNHSIPLVSLVRFEEKNIPISSYVLGYYLNNGNFCDKNNVVFIPDVETFNHMSSELKKSNLFLRTLDVDTKQYFISDQDMYRDVNSFNLSLKTLGLDSKQPFEVFIPEKYLFNSAYNRIELLKGLMDSKGFIDKKGKNFLYCTFSYKLAQDITHLVRSLGGVVKITEKKPISKISYHLVISLPKHINPFLLPRKSSLVISEKRAKPNRYIIDVTKVGVKECQCISVEHESRLYVTDNFIVTHNTFSAIKAALQVIMDKKEPNNEIVRIFLTKPIAEAGDEEIGFLPGDASQKTAPYFSSFYSNMEKLIGVVSTQRMKEKFIEEKIIAYERGSTFDNCVAILDEAQNLTVNGLKLYISRLGENAKMIIMGDTDQVDIKLKGNKVSGLEDAFKRFQDINGVAFHEFSEDDIVRSQILKDIMKRYKE